MTPHLFGLFCQFVFFNINFTLFPQVKQRSKGMKTNEKLVFVSYMDNKDEDVLYCKCHFVSNSWHRSIAEIISPSYTSLSFSIISIFRVVPKSANETLFSLHFRLCKCCNVQQCATLSVSNRKRMFPLGDRHTSFL